MTCPECQDGLTLWTDFVVHNGKQSARSLWVCGCCFGVFVKAGKKLKPADPPGILVQTLGFLAAVNSPKEKP